MARPESNTVSYFPHKIGDGKKIFSIETRYGNDGYATWFKILEKLATTENHFLNLNDEVEIMYLSAKCRVTEELLFAIITDLTRLGCFDKKLWENRIIWSHSFIESIQDAYSRRINKCITYESLCKQLNSLCNTETSKSVKKDDRNPQSKVKYSKVKEKDISVDESTPPNFDDLGENEPHLPNQKKELTLNQKAEFFINKFNDIRAKKIGKESKYRLTKKVMDLFKLRIKDYTGAEMIQAIRSMFDDSWHIENNYKDSTPEFILREEKMEKFKNKAQIEPITETRKFSHVL